MTTKKTLKQFFKTSLWVRWWCRLTLFSPPPTTTLKLWLSCWTTIIENCLKVSWTEVLITKDAEESTSRLIGGMEMWNRLIPHTCMMVKNQEWRSLVRIKGSQPRVPVAGGEVLITCSCENQQKLQLSETKGY